MMVIFPVNELRTQMAVIVRSDNFKICVIIGINAPIANRLKTTPMLSIMAYSSENVSVPIKSNNSSNNFYRCKICELDGRLFTTHSFTNSSSKDGKKPKYRLAQTQFDLIFTLSDFVSHQKRTFFLFSFCVFFCSSPDCTFSSSK